MNCHALPDPGTIELWAFGLDEPPERIEVLVDSLPSQEKARLDRGIEPVIGIRSTVARAGLRRILASYLDIPPQDIPLTVGKHGKPELDGVDLAFNISHSEAFAMAAICRGSRIGIDLETLRPETPIEELAGRCFSASEYRQWSHIAEQDRLSSFFHLWTQKEAFIKAHGGGMTIPLQDFDCQVDPSGQGGLIESRIEGDESSRWCIRGCSRHQGIRYSIACDRIECCIVDRDPSEVGLSRW